MKILLFNDNPVVQKLVALSAQKTKDELIVASSVEQIEEGDCDLLIVDDALYSDESFAAIKEGVACKSTLMMATRGNAVPAGFDNVINKPFLPTDLVDTLIQIDKRLASAAQEVAGYAEEEPSYSIDLEETLTEFEPDEEERLFADEETFEEAGLELETFEADEGTPKTAILDQEEVQEVRELLEDTDSEAVAEEEAFEGMDLSEFEGAEGELDEFDFGMLNEEETSKEAEKQAEEEEPFDFESLEEEGIAESKENASEEELFDFDEEMFAEEAESPQEKIEETDPYDFGELENEEFSIAPEEDKEAETFSLEEEFGELEMQIQEAMEDLKPEDLEMELDEELFGTQGIEEAAEMGELFDELDLLDERELKLAVGEEVEEEEETQVHVGESAMASIAAEALGEVIGKPVQAYTPEEKTPAEINATPAEGVEALQALLKALANEEVAKSLKGLNISININFGSNT